eukprot:632772-Pleurochrysis_carterae.AAC.3
MQVSLGKEKDSSAIYRACKCSKGKFVHHDLVGKRLEQPQQCSSFAQALHLYTYLPHKWRCKPMHKHKPERSRLEVLEREGRAHADAGAARRSRPRWEWQALVVHVRRSGGFGCAQSSVLPAASMR